MVNKYWCMVRMVLHYWDLGITRLALFLSVIKTRRIKELQVQMIKWGYFDHALTFHSSQTCVCGISITPSFGMYIFEGLVNQEGEIADGRAATYFVKPDLAFFPARRVLEIHDLAHRGSWISDNYFFDFRSAVDPINISMPKEMMEFSP